MARKLSRRSQQRIAKNLALIENINILLVSITEEAITDLVRRDAIGVGHDGYPADSMPEYSSGGFAGSSTESAALFGLSGAKNGGVDDWDRAQKRREGSDVVRKQLALIENNLRIANKALREAAFTVVNLNQKTEKIRVRQVSTPCSICGIQAAEKAGWCIADYRQWEADGKPDKVRYAMWRRQDTNTEGVILVVEMPKGKSNA